MRRPITALSMVTLVLATGATSAAAGPKAAVEIRPSPAIPARAGLRGCLLEGLDVRRDPMAPYLCLRGAPPVGMPSVPSSAGRAQAQAPTAAPPCAPVQGVDDRCEQWTQMYDDPDIASLSYQFTMGMALSPDGGTAFLAVKDKAGNADDPYSGTCSWVVLAYDTASGELLWQDKYQDEGMFDFPLAIAAAPDGSRVYATGASYNGDPLQSNGSRMLTIAYDAHTGARLWARTYDSPYGGIDNGIGVVATQDGMRVYAVAVSDAGHGDLDYVTVGYAAATGRRTWLRRYTGVGSGGIDAPFGIAVNPSGTRVFVTGWSAGTAEFDLDYGTVAYVAKGPNRGHVAWESRYDGIGADLPEEAFAIAVSPNGSQVVVTGLSGHQAGTARYDYGTVSYSASGGRQMWDARYSGPGGGFNAASSVAVSPDGARVFVTGQSLHASKDYDYGTAAYDASTGRQLWAQGYGGAQDDVEVANSVTPAPDGSTVYVTGFSEDSSSSIPFGGSGSLADQATVAYDAAGGSQAWVARYNATGYDFDNGIQALTAPDGRVLVAGQLDHQLDPAGNGNLYDAGLVAYAP